MSDNVTTTTTVATPPSGTVIATVEATFSGDTAQAGVGVLAKTSGSEGSRVLTIINPATEDKQDTGNTSLSSIDGKLSGAPVVAFDYTSLAQASTTDTWTRKSGGSGGTTVQTITVTYTDSTKTVISNVAWT